MSVQWFRRDHRLETDLAVCLDAGANLLIRAKSDRQLEEAVSFNLRLWRTIRDMARQNHHGVEREVLVNVADHVAVLLALDACPCVDPRDIAFVAGRNMALAGDFVSGWPTERVRDALVAEWAATGAAVRFEPWLLARLAARAVPS